MLLSFGNFIVLLKITFLLTSHVYLLFAIYRYMLLNDKGEKMKEQLGVVRTNCIDCLDRTNVTQVA